MKQKIFLLGLLLFFLLAANSSYRGAAQESKSHFGVQGGLPYFSQEMRQAGIEIVREWINWEKIESARGRYDWQEMDERVKAANELGIVVLGYFYNMPEWAKVKTNIFKNRTKKKVSDFCQPSDINDFKEFASRVAKRYDGRHGNGYIEYFEILNEVTVPEFFDYKNPDNRYEAWLINGYQGVKIGNPDAKVLIGGFVDPLGFKHTSVNPEVDKLINIMLSSYSRYFDIVSFHSYSYDAEGLRNSTKYIKEVMRKYNLNKAIWITETAIIGLSAELSSWQNKMAGDLIKRYVVAFGEGVQTVFWFTFVGTPIEGESPYGSGVKIIGLGWDLPKGLRSTRLYHPRQAYQTYALMSSKLKSFNDVKAITKTQYKFTFIGKNPVYVLWCNESSCGLPQELNGIVKLTDYLGNEKSQAVQEIKLTSEPVFIE